MAPKKIDPYAEFQQPLQTAAPDPYAEFQQPATTPAPPVDMSNVAGAGSYGVPSIAPPKVNMQPSMLGRDASPGVAQNFAKGAAKGALKTLSSADDFAGRNLPAFMTTPIGQDATPENSARAIQTAKNLAIPNGTAQKWGQGTEQAAEFLAPTGLEEAGAKLGAEALGRGAGLFGRTSGAALHSGIINSAQGGSFGAGAGMGAAGSLFGAGLKAAAPAMVESALGVRGVDRAYGATPGQAILNDTKGIAPGKVVESARNSLNGLQSDIGNMLDGSPQPVSLSPTRAVASDFLTRAVNENHEGTIKDLSKLGKQVDTEALTGNEIPDQVPAGRAAALNRGISNAIASWNPAATNDTMSAAGKTMHHTLGNSIAEVVPEIKPLNQRVQSLMPVVQRGNATDLNAGMLQRTIGRFKAHTGALSVGGAGAMAGAHFGGLPGAIAGGVGGLLGTEMMASPETWLAAGRAANSPVVPQAVRLFGGTALQAIPKKKGLFDQ